MATEAAAVTTPLSENAVRKVYTYTFHTIEACNFCGASSDRFKVMGRRLNGPQGRFPNKLLGVTTTICMCRDCELIFANPQPIPESISDHYGGDPRDFWQWLRFDLV